MANRMTPPAEGQEKDVLLVLDKQQGKVSAVKGIDKEGNLQTVPPTHGGEFMQVDKNSDVFSNFISNFFRKFQDTSGLELFSVKASYAEREAKAIEDNHHNPTPEGDKRAEMLRVPKPDFHEFKQGYRFDPAKIDWENLKKVGITADTLKNVKDAASIPADRRAAVALCMERGLISGYEDGTIRPQQTITRAAFAKLMVTAEF